MCGGRIVSVLEGGYRIQGEAVSAFARSVAAHVHALAEPNAQVRAPAAPCKSALNPGATAVARGSRAARWR